MIEQEIIDDVGALLDALPPYITEALRQVHDTSGLLEVVMDLGREPRAFAGVRSPWPPRRSVRRISSSSSRASATLGPTTEPASNARCTVSRRSATARGAWLA